MRVGVSSRLFAQGKLLEPKAAVVEDFASARIDLEGGATAQISCSWKLQAGCDAAISATFYGTEGGARFRNVNGSFYEFEAERFRGTSREIVASGQEDWGGRAAIDWARRLGEGEKYNPQIERIIEVAGTLDQIYGRE